MDAIHTQNPHPLNLHDRYGTECDTRAQSQGDLREVLFLDKLKVISIVDKSNQAIGKFESLILRLVRKRDGRLC